MSGAVTGSPRGPSRLPYLRVLTVLPQITLEGGSSFPQENITGLNILEPVTILNEGT
jgi:hypothetical protein